MYDFLEPSWAGKRRLGFSDFVKNFTIGITRMHLGDSVYTQEDFTKESWEFYNDDLIGNDEYLLDLNQLPKTFKFLSLDTPQSTKKWLEAFTQKDINADPMNKRIRDGVITKLTDVGMSYDEWWETYDADSPIEYNINSIGLISNLEFENLKENEFIPVFGCSHTQGLGSSEENLWFNHLGENLPIFNCGLSSSGPMEVFLLLRQLYEQKPFEKVYVCLPHAERIAQLSNKHIIEGGVHYQQIFLKQFSKISELVNAETKDMYTSITIDAIQLYCEANNIELKMYAKGTFQGVKDFVEWDIVAPPLTKMYKNVYKDLQIANPKQHSHEEIKNATARDMIHYGRNWHEKMAEYMLTVA
jgi:hypothetical protein